MPPRRLAVRPPTAATARLVTFTVDGRRFTGIDGEPVAVSLLAAGRTVLSRSFRFHRSRGLMCSTGQCGWCECEIDGVPAVRSCQALLREGMVVRSEHALPTVERDMLGALDRVSRWVPPTFYHHRLLRPRGLRRRYLDVIRWFGGRGRLDPDRARPIRPAAVERRDVDVVVIGGGPAGLVAATAAAEAGARVLLIEADAGTASSRPWILPPDVPPGALEEAALAAGVEIATRTTLSGIYGTRVTAVGPDRLLEFHPEAVIAATGSYERLPPVPGIDRPGVMGARAVAWVVRRYGVMPGDRALFVGSEPDLSAAREAFEGAGGRAVGAVPTASLLRIDGRGHVRAARVRDGTAVHRERVDLVVIGDRAPALEIPAMAGVPLRLEDGMVLPIVDDSGATPVPWVYVAGSAAGRPTGSPGGYEAARRCGAAAAAGRRRVDGGPAEADPGPAEAELARAQPRRVPAPREHGPTGAPVTPGEVVAGDALVCFCEDVRVREIRAEAGAGYHLAEHLKRRTGALTGPCQGKYCLQGFVEASGVDAVDALPTSRPPIRPVRLGDLVAAGPLDPAAHAVESREGPPSPR